MLLSRIFCIFVLVVVFFIPATFSVGAECNGSDCINSTNFSINVSTFTPGSTALANGGGSASTVNGVLGKIIDSLIVAF
jgi:hypothetical protein